MAGALRLPLIRRTLAFYLRKDDDLIIQEFLPGLDNEYTAGIFSDGRNKHCITFRRTLSPGGFSQQVELVEHG